MSGKYDIVYMVKDSAPNEELRHSLRSVEKNWGPRGKVWFFGGCPEGLKPDRFVPAEMTMPGKWENTHRLMRLICECEEISGDFWFFNDDFFVMRPTDEDMPQQYNGLLPDVIELVERGGDASALYWTAQLRVLVDWAEREGFGQVNYEVHKPMLINREKMLAVMEKYPEVLFTRSLYGNYYRIGGEDTGDIMIKYPEEDIGWALSRRPMFLSGTEESFAGGELGRYIRDKFPEPCPMEEDICRNT